MEDDVDSKPLDEIFVVRDVVADVVDVTAATGAEVTTALEPPTPAAFEQVLPVHFW